MDKEKLMIWTKITEDKATWPEQFQVCWLVGINGVEEMNWCFVDGAFQDRSGTCVLGPETFYYWAPATPPQFDVNDNEPVIVDKCVTEHKTLDFKTNCARCQYGKEYCYCQLKLR